MTKKKTTKPSLPKLNVDLKKYLDHNLAKDNLNLTRALDAANKKIEQLQEKVEQKDNLIEDIKENPEKHNKNLTRIFNIINKINDYTYEGALDDILLNIKKIKNKNKISHAKYMDILYELVDDDDGALTSLSCVVDHIFELQSILQDMNI